MILQVLISEILTVTKLDIIHSNNKDKIFNAIFEDKIDYRFEE